MGRKLAVGNQCLWEENWKWETIARGHRISSGKPFLMVIESTLENHCLREEDNQCLSSTKGRI